MTRRILLLLTLLLVIAGLYKTASGQPAKRGAERTQEYIENYKDIAISEMEETGIPASIKLAQGILESGSGESRLAKKGNNHFGIKCQRGEWQGETMLHDDDAIDECFRVYDDAEQSWEDHSEFLASGWRYQSLFDLDPLDYEAWAKGLQDAGYATNPAYANLLIRIIEEHNLYEYDRKASGVHQQIVGDIDDPDDRVFKYNGIEAIEVQEGETYESITKEFLYFNYQLARYNDIEQGTDLDEGTILYLKPKNWRPSERFHTVSEGQTMHDISQMYGVRLSRLYKRNRMDPEINEEPVAGEEVYLRGRRTDKPETRIAEAQMLEDSHDLRDSRKDDYKDESSRLVEYVHVVRAGEELDDIATMFEITEEDLKKWNGLPDDRIYKGELIFMYLPQDKVPAPPAGA